MRFTSLIPLFLLGLSAAQAAGYNDSPMIIVGDQKPQEKSAAKGEEKPAVKPTGPVASASAEAITQAFPHWAVSKAGADTAGQGPVPPPPSPANAALPTAPATPQQSPMPATPAAPPSPAPKLWPRDTIPIFMRSCTGLHIELVPACQCVITRMMVTIPHDEFLQLSADNRLDNDKRIVEIRKSCLGTPGKHKAPQG